MEGVHRVNFMLIRFSKYQSSDWLWWGPLVNEIHCRCMEGMWQVHRECMEGAWRVHRVHRRLQRVTEGLQRVSRRCGGVADIHNMGGW